MVSPERAFPQIQVSRRIRFGILASHPIQYRAPLYRALASENELDLEVLFCSRQGLDSYMDPGFGLRVRWDTPLLDGYKHVFLSNYGFSPAHGFPGVFNPGVLSRTLRHEFDVLLLYGWEMATNWLAWAAAAASGVPLLMRGDSSGLKEPTGVRGRVKRSILETLFARVAGFLAIGANNRDFYRSYGVADERIFLAPYSVDNAGFLAQARQLAPCKREIKRQFGIDPGSSVILYAGKLIPIKRPMDLIEAFANLRPELNATLAIVGDGPLRRGVEQFVRERGVRRVRFFGFRNQSEIAPCYAMADLLVLPSFYDAWGLVVNEAMCFALPVITSDRVGAARDLVREGENGFVYPMGDIAALTERIARVIRQPRLGEAMGRRSREIVSNWGMRETVRGFVEAAKFAVSRAS